MLGRTQIHLFTETKNSSGKWVAEAAASFTESQSPVSGRVVPTMNETPCPQDLPLFGMLCDGAWESLPWSFWQKGIPEDASPQVLAVCQEWKEDAFGHSHLTMEELLDKYEELKADARPQARMVAYSLGEMLYALMSGNQSNVTNSDRRVVFWFH